jgi:hypothetical protein
MEIDNPPPGYYVTFLGFVIQWKNSPNNDNAVNLATFSRSTQALGNWTRASAAHAWSENCRVSGGSMRIWVTRPQTLPSCAIFCDSLGVTPTH